jgi:uncharacterized membrane protein YgdD (TMEM256/DUF423 family)
MDNLRGGHILVLGNSSMFLVARSLSPRRSDKQVRVSTTSALTAWRDMSFYLFLGLVTPLGGLTLLTGWACVMLAGWKRTTR